MALGTILGGPIGDRIGRKQVIWWSIFGAAPFALALPYANLFWTGPLTFVIGLMMASAFPAIVVYGQELFPGRVGMISGLFFGLAFGLAGIGAALLGKLADLRSIEYVYQLCAWLPREWRRSCFPICWKGRPTRYIPANNSARHEPLPVSHGVFAKDAVWLIIIPS